MGMHSRAGLALVLAVLGSVAVPAAAAGAGTSTTGRPVPLGDAAAVAAMTELETRIDDSFVAGHAVPVVFDSPQQLPGHVITAPYWGDTDLWTGVYLGGEAMRYAVAQQHLGEREEEGQRGAHKHRSGRDDQQGKAANQQHAFWVAQRDQALARIHQILPALHRDINIAEDWSEQLKVPPGVNTSDPTGQHTADFGGGVFHGERGMIMRSCTPLGLGPLGIEAPAADHGNHVYELTWPHGDGGRYRCEVTPSRDTYAGLTFGLLTTFDLVGPADPALAAEIRDDLLNMGGFLLKHGWTYPRPNGFIGVHSDEDLFISPLMPHVPSARLNIANAARHVADISGSAADRQTWDAAWQEELASQGPLVGAEKEINTAQHNDGYFKFNLDHLTGFNLLRTTSGAEHDLIARGFAVMDKSTRVDGNAHFEALTYGLTGERARRDAAVKHLHEWLQYRAAIANGAAVTNSARCSRDLACVPRDRNDITFEPYSSAPITWYPGAPEAPPISRAADLRARDPLPVALRPPTDFLWQAPPTALDGQRSADAREPGIDYLTPYWTVRYFSEVAPPPLRPFPTWVGPRHS